MPSGKTVGTTEYHAVGGNQRDEDAEDLVKLIGEGLHQELDTGGQCGDDHHENRQAHGSIHHPAYQRYGHAGAAQYQDRGQPESQGIDSGVAHAEQRTESEKLHQCRIVLPEPIGAQLAIAGIAHGSFLCCPAICVFKSLALLAWKYCKAW